jgi:hypothetical protein
MKLNSEHDGVGIRQSRSSGAAGPLGHRFSHWREITLRPVTYFRECRFDLGLAWRVYLQNVTIGILIYLVLTATYWFLLLTHASAGHWKYYLATLAFLTYAPLLLCLASAAMIVLPSLIAYGMFRLTGGSGNIVSYLSRVLVCSNFEWLNGGFLSAALLFNDYAGEYDSPLSFPMSPVIMALISLAGVLSIRTYYAILQIIALRGLHYGNRQGSRRIASVTFLVLNLLSGAFLIAMYSAILLVAVTNLD